MRHPSGSAQRRLEHAKTWRSANSYAKALTGADDVMNRIVLGAKTENQQKHEDEFQGGHCATGLMMYDPPAPKSDATNRVCATVRLAPSQAIAVEPDNMDLTVVDRHSDAVCTVSECLGRGQFRLDVQRQLTLEEQSQDSAPNGCLSVLRGLLRYTDAG